MVISQLENKSNSQQVNSFLDLSWNQASIKPYKKKALGAVREGVAARELSILFLFIFFYFVKGLTCRERRSCQLNPCTAWLPILGNDEVLLIVDLFFSSYLLYFYHVIWIKFLFPFIYAWLYLWINLTLTIYPSK